MSIFKTLGRVLLGFLLASLTAGLIQVLYVDTPVEIAAAPARVPVSLELALLAATHSAIFGAAFTLIAAAIAEWLAIRGIVYYMLAGVVIALLGFAAQYASEVTGQPTILNNYALKAYLTAGFFAGLVYWLIAGRRAGARGDEWFDRAPETEPAGHRPHIIVEKEPMKVKMGSLAERLARRRGTAEVVTESAASVAPAAAAAAAAPAPKPATGGTSVPVTKGPAQKPAEAKVTIELPAKDKPQPDPGSAPQKA